MQTIIDTTRHPIHCKHIFQLCNSHKHLKIRNVHVYILQHIHDYNIDDWLSALVWSIMVPRRQHYQNIITGE